MTVLSLTGAVGRVGAGLVDVATVPRAVVTDGLHQVLMAVQADPCQRHATVSRHHVSAQAPRILTDTGPATVRVHRLGASGATGTATWHRKFVEAAR